MDLHHQQDEDYEGFQMSQVAQYAPFNVSQTHASAATGLGEHHLVAGGRAARGGSREQTPALGEEERDRDVQLRHGRLHTHPGGYAGSGVDGDSEEDEDGGSHGKWLNDPIHSLFRLDQVAMRMVDTPAFQRLRSLKQLGLSYYVFPGASHNRFEHSLGTAHLAEQVMMQLHAIQRRELDITARDTGLVTLAGLCHDLGHGPFSHVFDREFLDHPRIKPIALDWEHEEMSCKLVQHIIDDACIDHPWLDAQGVALVQDLIRGGPTRADRGWMFDIVANKRNSIDVDKFDYLLRDSYNCKVPISFELGRISKLRKVLDDQICYKYTEYRSIYKLFDSRLEMHRTVYTHRKAKAVELMVVDALVEADVALKISDRIHDPRLFISLDDSLMNKIMDYEECYRSHVADGNDAPLRAARAKLEDVQRRRLYRFVNEVPLTKDVSRPLMQRPDWKEYVASQLAGLSHGKMRQEDIIVHACKINFCKGDSNPLDKVRFFGGFGCTRSIQRRNSGYIQTEVFEEVKLRIYSRSRDDEACRALHQALIDFYRRVAPARLAEQIQGTPFKPARQRPVPQASALAAPAASTVTPARASQGQSQNPGPAAVDSNDGDEEEDAPKTTKRRRSLAYA